MIAVEFAEFEKGRWFDRAFEMQMQFRLGELTDEGVGRAERHGSHLFDSDIFGGEDLRGRGELGGGRTRLRRQVANRARSLASPEQRVGSGMTPPVMLPGRIQSAQCSDLRGDNSFPLQSGVLISGSSFRVSGRTYGSQRSFAEFWFLWALLVVGIASFGCVGAESENCLGQGSRARRTERFACFLESRTRAPPVGELRWKPPAALGEMERGTQGYGIRRALHAGEGLR